MVASITIAIFVTVYTIIMPKQGEAFTEFYILGPGKMASDYPTNLVVGDTGRVIIGVVNNEYANVSYLLEVKLDGVIIDQKIIHLEHKKTWEETLTFQVEKRGQNQKLEFLLYKYPNPVKKSVYRSIHLFVDVT